MKRFLFVGGGENTVPSELKNTDKFHVHIIDWYKNDSQFPRSKYDCVVIISKFISHSGQEAARRYSRVNNVPLVFSRGRAQVIYNLRRSGILTKEDLGMQPVAVDTKDIPRVENNTNSNAEQNLTKISDKVSEQELYGVSQEVVDEIKKSETSFVETFDARGHRIRKPKHTYWLDAYVKQHPEVFNEGSKFIRKEKSIELSKKLKAFFGVDLAYKVVGIRYSAKDFVNRQKAKKDIGISDIENQSQMKVEPEIEGSTLDFRVRETFPVQDTAVAVAAIKQIIYENETLKKENIELKAEIDKWVNECSKLDDKLKSLKKIFGDLS